MLDFLPINKEEMKKRGWDYCDFVYISGDAYIDHPSFGVAIISRVLEKFNYRVCILPQPDINNNEEFLQFGTPRLGFLISSGNIDSMVNHYSVSLKRRKFDYYTPNGEMGKRPDRAVIKYSNKVRELFNHSPIIIGGIEASLRRLAHYDYWDNKVRRSILLDSKADLLLYGMGEKTIIEVADCLNSGLDIKDIIFLRNSCYKTKDPNYIPPDSIELPTYDEVLESKEKYVDHFLTIYNSTDPYTSKPLIERYKNITVVQNPPEFPFTRDELDQTYDLEYMRDYHPIYKKLGHIKAIEEVKFSLVSNRGCFGGCNFCALTMHQGRQIQSRSKESLVNEAKKIIKLPDFKGYIHDVGGPTANFYNKACKKQEKHGVCTNKQCVGYLKCNNLEVSHTDYLDILKELRSLENVKKVFIRSGIRYDYLMYDKDETFFYELVKNHISGQLKVAPEHISSNVLKNMNKPSKELYLKFVDKYHEINQKCNKNQFLVPYLMSSHPGSTLEDAIELACYLKSINHTPEQVQDFYPTPMTASTCMYYTGINPFTKEKIYVAKTKHEKAMQRALIQFKYPQNYDLVREALIKANRRDLIGNGKHCLIKDRK